MTSTHALARAIAEMFISELSILFLVLRRSAAASAALDHP
jgi:hypothetical protein